MVRIDAPARLHKAARLVHTRAVRPIRARVFEVKGDTGVYHVTTIGASASCTCAWGRQDHAPHSPKCSHIIAVRAWVAMEKVKGDPTAGFPGAI